MSVDAPRESVKIPAGVTVQPQPAPPVDRQLELQRIERQLYNIIDRVKALR